MFGEKIGLAADLYWSVDFTDSFKLASDAGPQVDVELLVYNIVGV